MDTKTILVVDDDRAVRDAFAIALADDYDLTIVKGGALALDAVRAKRPDLVFLDLNMPDMDGVETLVELKRIDPTLKVYIVTAFAAEYMDRLSEARRLGIEFEIASKPLATEQIELIASTMA